MTSSRDNLHGNVPASDGPLSTTERVHEAQLPSRGLPEISSLVYAAGHHILLTGILAGLLGLSFGFVAAVLVPPQYLASGLVKVSQREGYLLTTRQSRSDDALFLRAQESSVVQQTTLERALKNAALQEAMATESIHDPIDWLKGQIKADIPNGSELLTITASNPSPKLALLVSKAVTQAYVDLTVEQHQAVCQKRIQELETAATEADEQLRLRWKGLRSQAESLGSGNPQSLTVTEQMKVMDFRESTQRLRTVQLQRGQLEIQLAEHKAKVEAPTTLSDRQIQERVFQDREVASRAGYLRQLDAKIREIQGIASDMASPRLVRLQTERDHLASEFEEVVAVVERQVREKLSAEQPKTTPSNINSLEKQLALLHEEEVHLQKSVADLENSIEKTSGPNSVELEMTRNEIAREKELADSLWKTLHELRIEEQADPRVALISLPKKADKLTRNKQLKAAVAGMFTGILLAILGVGYVEWSTCRIRYIEDVETNVGLEFFGCMSGPQDSAWVPRLFNSTREADRSGASEVAARLLNHLQTRANPQSIFVTSSVRSEPRSSVADELAEVLAANGKRVLLIDCDESDRAIEEQWGRLDSAYRASMEWRKQVRLSKEFGYDYLSLIQPQKPLSLVASQDLEPILQDPNLPYDFVIVLGPAILTTAEGVFLSFRIEQSILAIRIGESSWDTLAAARSRLEASHSYVLGVVSENDRPTRRVGMLTRSHEAPFGSVASIDSVASSETTPSIDEEMLHQEVRRLQDQLISHETHDHLRPPTKLATRRDHVGGHNRNSE